MNEFHLPAEHPLNLKTILAMDFGQKFIKGNEAVLKELKNILDNECVDLVVIGLPYLIDGKKTASTERAQLFVNNIREQISQPVEEQDETLSTFEAESRMKSSIQYNFKVDLSQIDAVAACVILEDFIRRTRANPPL